MYFNWQSTALARAFSKLKLSPEGGESLKLFIPESYGCQIAGSVLEEADKVLEDWGVEGYVEEAQELTERIVDGHVEWRGKLKDPGSLLLLLFYNLLVF